MTKKTLPWGHSQQIWIKNSEQAFVMIYADDNGTKLMF